MLLISVYPTSKADAFTTQNRQHRNHPKNKEIFNSKLNNNHLNVKKPKLIEKTEKYLSNIDENICKLKEVEGYDLKTEENEYPAKSISTNSSSYSETITFFDGYKAKAVNLAIDHQLVKYRYDWKINDIDLKNTEKINRFLAVG